MLLVQLVSVCGLLFVLSALNTVYYGLRESEAINKVYD